MTDFNLGFTGKFIHDLNPTTDPSLSDAERDKALLGLLNSFKKNNEYNAENDPEYKAKLDSTLRALYLAIEEHQTRGEKWTEKSVEDFLKNSNVDFEVISTGLFPRIADRILAVMVEKSVQLDGRREAKQEEISALAAKIEVVSIAQSFLSGKSKGVENDKEVNGLNDSFEISKEKLEANPELVKLLNSEYGQNIDPDNITGPASINLQQVTDKMLDGYGKVNGTLKREDVRDLSERLSNQSKILNDDVNQKTVEYQDFNSKYDAALEAISRFIEKYFQVANSINNRTA